MIVWSLKKFKIEELVPYEKNARTLSQRQAQHLSDSIDRFGIIDKPVINQDKTVIGGHQRLDALQLKGSTEAECWYPDRELTDKEVEELNIRLNRVSGEFDYDMLGNLYEVGDLLSWGFDEDDLGLDKPGKKKKEPKPAITLEFDDKQTMLEYLPQCEKVATMSESKMKVRG